MKAKPQTKEAIRLMNQGALALSHASQQGIRIDIEYCQRQEKHLERKIKYLRNRLKKTDLYKLWKKRFGNKTNWQSNEQLADVLYIDMGFETDRLTEKGSPSTDQLALESLGLKEVSQLIEVNRLVKAKNTYLAGILREVIQHDDDLFYMHPFFHLNIIPTYRSSSSNINFQNLPKRVPEIMKLIRKAFRPRPGNVLMGIDFSGVEVRGAYCYHKDPKMREAILNPKKDMHRDMGMECYKLNKKEMGEPGSKTYKVFRHCGKNKFVFPQFYGDYYVSCAKALWDETRLLNMKTAQGVSVKTHLKKKGMRKLSQFENHIKKVESDFWNKRFKIYTKWKKKWYQEYQKRGYFDTLSGFRCQGYMTRNQVINYPIQGTSFHFLLFSFIEFYKKRRQFKSRLIGQIHDEVIWDVVPEEYDALTKLCIETMTALLPQAWEWINIPLEVDVEKSEINGNWYQME